MILVDLFVTFIKIGFLSIGGGYASLPYIQTIVVEQNQWIDMTTYIDLLTLSQMTPGPIAINAASFVGMKLSGVLGAFVATLGFVLPSFVIVIVLSLLYYKYQSLASVQLLLSSLRPVVVALIISFVVSLLKTALQTEQIYFNIIVILIGVFLLRKKHISPILLILICGGVNILTLVF